MTKTRSYKNCKVGLYFLVFIVKYFKWVNILFLSSMHILCGQFKQITQSKPGKTWGHTEVPSDGLKAVGKIEGISQETEDVYCSFIVDT